VKFANEYVVFVGAADRLCAEVPKNPAHPASRNLARKLSDVVADEQAKHDANERLPLSTEIVESCFGKYKQLEGQHAREGFTGLILGLAMLLGNYDLGTIANSSRAARSKTCWNGSTKNSALP